MNDKPRNLHVIIGDIRVTLDRMKLDCEARAIARESELYTASGLLKRLIEEGKWKVQKLEDELTERRKLDEQNA